MSLVVLELDPELAAHVVVALHRHRAWLRESGRPVPAGLVELLDAATRARRDAAQSGEDRRGPAAVEPTGLDGLYAQPVPQFLTPRAAAAALGRSERTIRDRCAAGELGAFREGRAWRIPRAALEKLAAGGSA